MPRCNCPPHSTAYELRKIRRRAKWESRWDRVKNYLPDKWNCLRGNHMRKLGYWQGKKCLRCDKDLEWPPVIAKKNFWK